MAAESIANLANQSHHLNAWACVTSRHFCRNCSTELSHNFNKRLSDMGSLRLKVPPGTQNGQVFRLKSQGMPVSNKPEETGDLYATAEVQLPRTLTDEQRRSFEELVKSGL